MAQLGDIFEKAGSYFAKIDTKEKGVRYAMVGPPRCGAQAALQDLAAIRTGAAGAPTRSEGLQAMERIAKRLRDEAKVAMRGGIKTESADRMFARIKLTYDSVHHEINGPPRQAERRAKADLAKLRQAAQGHATMKESIAAMRQKSRELHQEAEFEANVAMGVAQYGLVRDAHKVVDSDPESDGPAPVDHDDSFEAADFSDPAVVKKFFPPPAPKPPRAPPRDAADATRQLADFMPSWCSPRNPGRPWAPIFLKSNTYRYIGTLSLLFGFHLLIYWAPAVDFLTYWALVWQTHKWIWDLTTNLYIYSGQR